MIDLTGSNSNYNCERSMDKNIIGRETHGVREFSKEYFFKILNDAMFKDMFSREKIVGLELDNGRVRLHTEIES